MTQLAEYDVTVVLARGDERRVLTVRLPAAGEDLAAAAGHELADSIAEATGHEWTRADVDGAVTATVARPAAVGDPVHLPPRYGGMARIVGEVLAVDEHGDAEVRVADMWGSYGCFYLPAVDLRPCTHLTRADIDVLLDRLGEAVRGRGSPPGSSLLLPGPDEG